MERGFSLPALGRKAEWIGLQIVRYALVIILLYIGGLKWTAGEAVAIQAFIQHSPLLSWIYSFSNVRSAAVLIGSMELIIALLIAFRPFSATLSAIGSTLAIGMFITTLSFLLTTPELPSIVQQFVVKDLLSLGAAVLTAGEAWAHTGRAQSEINRGGSGVA